MGTFTKTENGVTREATLEEFHNAILNSPDFQPFRDIMNVACHLSYHRRKAKEAASNGDTEKAEHHTKQAEYIKKHLWPVGK